MRKLEMQRFPPEFAEKVLPPPGWCGKVPIPEIPARLRILDVAIRELNAKNPVVFSHNLFTQDYKIRRWKGQIVVSGQVFGQAALVEEVWEDFIYIGFFSLFIGKVRIEPNYGMLPFGLLPFPVSMRAINLRIPKKVRVL